VLLRPCLIAFALFIGSAAPTLAQDDPEFRGEYRDWRVFTRGSAEGQICFALSRPADSAPQALTHGDVYFLVASWQSGSVSEQPSLLVGYELRPASPPEVRVGSGRFDMYTDGQEAFLDDLDDEPSLVRAMKRGSVMRVTATTSDGMATAYEFSLAGVTAALQRAQSLCS
jgi:hypothetical protein